MELPQDFIERTKKIIGEEWDAFVESIQNESPTSIRVNPSKCTHDLFSSQEKVSWASNAYYLDSRPSFTLDPLLHAGIYYVQEASSMYLEQIIKKYILEPAKVLDLCAAPGGKSTQLAAILPEKSLLVANEVIRSRANILAENLIKWGNPNTMVTNNDPAVLGSFIDFFDVIVTDVPCSGEGMFRKDPSSILEWSVNNVKLCAERQKRIIADVWLALKPGGILIYSTCTYNKEENEDNLEWICNELNAIILEEPKRFMPHKTKGEGFFIAALKKDIDSKEYSLRSSNNKFKKSQKKNNSIRTTKEITEWIKYPSNFKIISHNNHFFAIKNEFYDDYEYLSGKLKVVTGGICLGEEKGKDIIPSHSLAMSTYLNRDSFPSWDLSKENALRYLRKEALFEIPLDLPKGYILVTFEGYSLGFIKNIGNRANNLYPHEWRIRMNIS